MPKATPRVTVGIPVFNGQEWLAETIESVIGQTLEDVVVIVSDNASTDNSWEIARELAGGDSRIRCYRNDNNVGVFQNLDRVFALSATPYFKWCAVGDLLADSFLDRAVTELEEQRDVSLVYAKTKFFGSSVDRANIKDMDVPLDSIDPVWRYRSYLSARGLNSPFHGLIRSPALSKTGLNKGFRGSDVGLIAALLLQGRFVRLPDELLYRRIEPSTSTSVKTPQELDEFFGAHAVSVNELSIWKLETQLFRDLINAPVDLSTKFKVAGYLVRRLYWQRQKLFREWRSYLRDPQ